MEAEVMTRLTGGRTGRGLLISLLVIWFSALAAYVAISFAFDAYAADLARRSDDLAPVSFMILEPEQALIWGVVLTVLVIIHWWLAALFGKPGMARMPLANAMLVLSGVGALLVLFDQASGDYYQYSLFCRSGEPMYVIIVDEVYQCERSSIVRRTAMWMALLLPLLAIPMRVIESRLKRWE